MKFTKEGLTLLTDRDFIPHIGKRRFGRSERKLSGRTADNLDARARGLWTDMQERRVHQAKMASGEE